MTDHKLDKIVFSKLKGSPGFISDTKTGGHKMTEWPFQSFVRRNSDDSTTFTYEAEEKYINFTPSVIQWRLKDDKTVTLKSKPDKKAGVKDKKKVKYASAYGTGIDLSVEIDDDRWRKVLTIDAKSNLGAIPADAEYLEVLFEIEHDFEIAGWDKSKEIEITKAIKMGEDCWIEAVKVWDSSDSVYDDDGEIETDTGNPTRCKAFLMNSGGKLYLKKQIPVSYLEDATYPLMTDTEISYGSEYIFNSATTNYMSVSSLDSTHFVVAYMDAGNSNYGTAIVGVVSGTTISYGSENVFNSASTNYSSVSSLDSTHFVVAYRDDGNSYHGTAIVGVVSGTTISYGSENVFNSATTYYMSVSSLDSTHFVVAYRDNGNSNYGTAIVGVVSGTTISSYGSGNVFNSAATSYMSVSSLDSTHFVVAYSDNGNSNYGTAIIGVVSGTTISYGSENVFNSAATYFTSVSSLDSTHFVVAYSDNGNSNYGTAIIGVVSGTTISYGSENVFNSATTNYMSVSSLDSTHFVVAFQDDGGDDYGIAMIGTIPAPEPTFTPQVIVIS